MPTQPWAKKSKSKPETNGESQAAKLAAETAQAAPEKPKVPPQFAGKTVAAVFGEMVWLLSRSPKHRDLKLSDLEWFLMPPLLLRQFKLHYRGSQPVMLELFAECSPEVAARIDAGERKLAPADWRSGRLPDWWRRWS
jgi:cytolysin-activating lysine-acyltransferase